MGGGFIYLISNIFNNMLREWRGYLITKASFYIHSRPTIAEHYDRLLKATNNTNSLIFFIFESIWYICVTVEVSEIFLCKHIYAT